MLGVIVDEREKLSRGPTSCKLLGGLLDYRVLEVGDYIVQDQIE